MSTREFNYMSECLVSTLDNLLKAKSIHEVYYQKGIVRALEDILYKFSDDKQLNALNRLLTKSSNGF